MFSVFIDVVFPVLLILVMGYAIGKKLDMHTKTLSTLSLYILTPCLMFQALVRYDDLFTMTTLKMLGVITLLMILIIVGVELIGRALKTPKPVRVALTLTLMLSNSGNFGLLINEYAFGEEAFIIASIIMVIYSFYTNTAGIAVAASDKSDTKTALLKIFKIPFIYVIIVAFVLNYFQVDVPDQIFNPVQKVGLAAIPINLIQLGINLSRIDWIKLKKFLPKVLLTSVLKLAVIPFMSYFLLIWIGIEGLEFKATLSQIAMPSAVYCSILASHYDADAELTSAMVLGTTLFSLLSLSALIYFLQGM